MKDGSLSRRDYLLVSALAGCSILLNAEVSTAQNASAADDIDRGPVPVPGIGQLRTLMGQLAKAPRRRDFKTVPMILDTPDLWDSEGLDAIIAYRGTVKQLWDNTEIGGPWLNLMRNSLNTQVFSFRNPDFLEVFRDAWFSPTGSLRSRDVGEVSARQDGRWQL